jgi:TPR repeat protein
MRQIKLLLVLLAVCAVAAPAIAGQYEDANAALEIGDYALAAHLYRPLAEQGNAEAQYNLGAMYDGGRGVSQDHAMAMSWYRKAAAAGSARAQFLLGVVYDIGGAGLPQDYETATSWFRKAADQGDSGAQYVVGLRYGLGQGAPRDVVEAHKWLNLAASAPEPAAPAREARDLLAKEMTAAQIADAQKRAREWRPKPAR